MILAIIQSIPTHPTRVVRTDTFAKFQHLCGMIEQVSYLAAHAACHATMNGMDRTLVVDAQITDPNSLVEATQKLFEAGPFDALVMPGILDPDLQKAVCDACANQDQSFKYRVFLDAPRNTSVDELIKRQTALPRFATLAAPWISTITPGRRSAEWLPPSCVIAPLALCCADYLRGVHELEALNKFDAEELRDAGIEVMTSRYVQRRPVIGRLTPIVKTPVPKPALYNEFVEVKGLPEPKETDPIQSKIDRDEAAIEQMLMEQIDARCDEILKLHPQNNAALWSSLKRSATSVLLEAKARGQIKGFQVRCDEETASWGTPKTPVVEVLISFAKRVKQVKFVSHRV